MFSNLNTVVLRDVAFEYPRGPQLFNNITYSFQAETVGLVGVNGAGKSTLANIISENLKPTKGDVLVSRKVIILKQEEARPKKTVNHYLLEIWDNPLFASELWLPLLAKIDLDQELTTLSGGEWMRVRLVETISRSPGLLILDEPTNNLDQEGRELIYRFLDIYKDPLLVISHDRQVLRRVNKILELSSLGLKVYGGNFDFYRDAKSREESQLADKIGSAKLRLNQVQRQELELVKAQEARNKKAHKVSLQGGIPRIVRGALKRRAQETLGKVKVQRATISSESKDMLVDLQDQQRKKTDFALEFANLKLPAGKLVFETKEFNIHYPKADSWLWSEDLTWCFRGPQRWGLIGSNGVGKSTLVKSLLETKENLFCKGSMEPGKLHIAYLDQKYRLLNASQSLLENIQAVSDLDAVELRNRLARFQFTGEMVLRLVSDLSGGEKLKAALAKILLDRNPVQFLILDEPTNNLDLESLEVLTETLMEFNGALLVISHDSSFLESLNLDGRIELKGPGIAL